MKYEQTKDVEEFFKLNYAALKRALRFLFKSSKEEVREKALHIFVLKAEYTLNNYSGRSNASFSTYINSCLKQCFFKSYRDSKAQKRCGEHVSVESWDRAGDLSCTELVANLNSRYRSLSITDRKCVKLRSRGFTLDEIKGETGMSTGYISQVCNKFRRNHLKKE